MKFEEAPLPLCQERALLHMAHVLATEAAVPRRALRLSDVVVQVAHDIVHSV